MPTGSATRFGPLLLTLALAAPWPMVWGYAGWLLRGDVAAPEAVRALGAGLQSAGLLILLLGGLRVMCREQGVADVHLGWPADKRRLLAVNAGWLLAVLLPSSIVVPATEFLSDEVARNGLGRGAFIVGSALLGVFGYRLLKFNGGLVEPRAGVKFGGWIWRMRHVWFALGVGGPLALGVLAAAGYYYSALAVESPAVPDDGRGDRRERFVQPGGAVAAGGAAEAGGAAGAGEARRPSRRQRRQAGGRRLGRRDAGERRGADGGHHRRRRAGPRTAAGDDLRGPGGGVLLRLARSGAGAGGAGSGEAVELFGGEREGRGDAGAADAGPPGRGGRRWRR